MFENGGFIRFLGGMLAGKTGDDLELKSNVLIDMTRPPFTDALNRFKHRALFGNVKNDALVGSSTSLISTQIRHIASFSELKPLKNVTDVHVHYHHAKDQTAFLDLEDLNRASSDFKAAYFIPDSIFHKVSEMIKGMSKVEFQRYPITIAEGNAHVCIICHTPKDEDQVGRAVLDLILPIFGSASE